MVIGASNGTGDGREKGVVGVVGMDDAVVAGDDMTEPVAFLKFWGRFKSGIPRSAHEYVWALYKENVVLCERLSE